MFKNLKPLTEKQGEVLMFILKYMRRYGYAPRYIDIERATKCKNNGTTSSVLDGLCKKGYISKEKNSHRGIILSRALDGVRPSQIKRKIQ